MKELSDLELSRLTVPELEKREETVYDYYCRIRRHIRYKINEVIKE